MAIRDMDIAAEIIGVNPFTAKLYGLCNYCFFMWCCRGLLFSGLSGCGRGWRGFGLKNRFGSIYDYYWRFGSIFGIFAGAAFMVLLPVFLKIYLWVAWMGNGSGGAP